MNSRTLRLAYRLLRIAALADRVELLKKKYPESKIDPEQVDKLSKLDPTGGKFLEWMVRVFVNNTYPVGFWRNVTAMLRMYAEIINSPTLAEMYGVPRDINKMDPTDLRDLWNRESIGAEEDKERLTTEALRAKKVKQQGSRVIYNQGGYKVVQFGGPEMDPDMAIEALCMFGAGTEWCTRKSDRAKYYLQQGPVYMIFKGDVKVAQVNEDQIQDRENKAIDLKKNSEITQVLVGSGIISPKQAYHLLSRGWGDKGPWPELEPALARDPEIAFKYANNYLHGRFPLGERAIAQDATLAYSYALMTLEDRFPEGEEAIFKDPTYGPMYQRDIDQEYFDFVRKRREEKRGQLQNA